MSRYILLPVDNANSEAKTITIPDGLVFNELYVDLRPKVINKSKLKMITDVFAKNEISEADDGSILQRDKKIAEGFSLKEALVDTCNNKFLEKYERFYKILRMLDIVF